MASSFIQQSKSLASHLQMEQGTNITFIEIKVTKSTTNTGPVMVLVENFGLRFSSLLRDCLVVYKEFYRTFQVS